MRQVQVETEKARFERDEIARDQSEKENELREIRDDNDVLKSQVERVRDEIEAISSSQDSRKTTLSVE